MSSKKKRLELQIDKEKDHDVVYFLENNVDNQAGFIKNLIREYVRYKNGNTNQNQGQQLNEGVKNGGAVMPPKKEDNPELEFLQQNAITSDDLDHE